MRRIPEWSGSVYAYRLGPDGNPTEEVARAAVYGRGRGSPATEAFTLVFRFRPIEGQKLPAEGEELELHVDTADGSGTEPAVLDVLTKDSE